MFLAFKEIKHERLRYGLIILMIFLISYLIFILSALAIGLADENTQAIKTWNIKRVVLNKASNVSLDQSLLTKKDLARAKLSKKEAELGSMPLVAKAKGHASVSAEFLGLKKGQFIYHKEELIAGHKAHTNHQVTVDQSFKNKGYHLGDYLRLNNSSKKYQIVGFVKNAKINIAPIIYGSLTVWKDLHQVAPNVVASGLVSQKEEFSLNHQNAKTYGLKKFVNKLPGYTAQNETFEMMIGFLFVISLIIIAVFLYILTMQKMHNFAVMLAQGIPARTLVWSTISQAILLMVSGIVLGLILMYVTLAIMPSEIPMSFTPLTMIFGSLGLLLMGIIGSLIPVRSILKVDPAQTIGE